MFRPPTPLVKNLLIVNIGIFLVERFMNMDLGQLFALYPVFSDSFQPYQFVTYMFLHGGTRHIFGNMLILFFVGPMLENYLGQKKFLILFMVTGLGGGFLYTGANYIEVGGLRNDIEAYVANPNAQDFNRLINDYIDNPSQALLAQIDRFSRNENDPGLRQQSVQLAFQLYDEFADVSMVGASGAIYGLMAMLMILFPNTEILLFFTFPVKIKYVVGVMIIYAVFSELERSPGDNVAHLAHLGGGTLFAWFLHKYWQKDRSEFY